MNDLLDIYKRIEYLRNKGVKMKENSRSCQYGGQCTMSSLYSSVLPAFVNCVKNGMPEENALDYALFAGQ